MRYRALATDYDETIAERGILRPVTRDALRQVRGSGRKLLLVTGRELRDLQTACSCLDLFDLVVCENGAILFDPHTCTHTFLADAPSPVLAEALRSAGVDPLEIGEVMISTHADQKELLLRTVREIGAEVEIVLNKTSVMILPAGVDKGWGLEQALQRVGLRLCDVVAIGDAENDYAMLAVSGFAVAVANAVPQLKSLADWVTTGSAGDGAAELIARLLANDLSDLRPSLRRSGVCTP